MAVRHRWVIISFVLSLSLLSAAEGTKPNVVVMLVDDLGSGDVSCLFRDVLKTPNIDRLAKKGVIFRSGYAPVPLCGPSRAGFLTGNYPQRFQFVDNSGGIPETQPLLQKVLQDAGYHTGLIGKWHSSGPMPEQRGCFNESLCSPRSSPFIDYHHPVLARNGVIEKSDEYSTDLFAREAESFIERNKEKPFFLTVTFNAPHILKIAKRAPEIAKDYLAGQADHKVIDVPKEPMARPGEALKFAEQFPGDTARADTAATIFALDQAVGRILDKIQHSGLEKNTIVFFFGDNGGHPENRSENLPLRDYKWTLYEGGLRVPFLAAYPGVIPAGLDYREPIVNMDVFATCTALAGGKPPATMDGINLIPHLTGAVTSAPHDYLFFSISGTGAVRHQQWKLYIPKDGESQLYDLEKDISEKNDLAATEPAIVKELHAKWETWNKQIPEVKGKNKNNNEDEK